MKLNLGCGRNIIPGWINVDIREGPGVDRLVNLDEPNCLGAFPTASVDEIKALGVLEHLWHWEYLILEMARVLKPNTGFVQIRVPYRRDYVAYHVRHFDENTFNPYRSDHRPRGYDLKRRVHTYGSLEFEEPYYILEDLWIEHFYPFAWHVAKYVLGERAYRIPLGKAINMHATLRRDDRPWQKSSQSPQ